MNKEEKKVYKQRIAKNRQELREIGVKNALYYFTIKYREYKYDDRKTPEFNRLDNLWFGKIIDEDFAKKMSAFVKFKRVQFQ